jgi:hypothetical protein
MSLQGIKIIKSYVVILSTFEPVDTHKTVFKMTPEEKDHRGTFGAKRLYLKEHCRVVRDILISRSSSSAHMYDYVLFG